MEMKRIGYNFRHGSQFRIDRKSGSGDYLLLLIKTEAYAVQNGIRLTVPQNSAIVFKKGSPQIYGAVGDVFVNDWIHFEMTKEEEAAFSELEIPFDTILPIGEVGELSGFVKSIFFERRSQNAHKDAVSKRYFDLLLFKLSEKIHTQSSRHKHPLYSQFYKLRSDISLEPQNEWSIDLICKRMMLSRSHVQHLYKSFFGTSIVADVQSCRIEYAKYLLSATEMTVTAISHACGYDSDVHFMRIFKRESGITPSEFRKRN